jgi:hypothetical protein
VFPLALESWVVSWDQASARLTVEAGAADAAARTLRLRRLNYRATAG